MPGTPKKRANRRRAAAEAAVAAESAAADSRAPEPAAKPARKRKPPATKRKAQPRPKRTGAPAKVPSRVRVRAAFEPATDSDYEALADEIEKAAVRHAQSKARDKGPLTAAERIERDQAIVAAHALSMSPTTIGAKFDLTDDHVRVIIAAHRLRQSNVPDLSSSEMLADALAALEAQMERLSLLASREISTGPDHPGIAAAAVVGAIRTWREMWVSRLDLLVIMGKVKSQPAREEHERRAMEKLRELLAALRKAGVDEEVLREAAEGVLLDDRAGPNVRAIEARAR